MGGYVKISSSLSSRDCFPVRSIAEMHPTTTSDSSVSSTHEASLKQKLGKLIDERQKLRSGLDARRSSEEPSDEVMADMRKMFTALTEIANKIRDMHMDIVAVNPKHPVPEFYNTNLGPQSVDETREELKERLSNAEKEQQELQAKLAQENLNEDNDAAYNAMLQIVGNLSVLSLEVDSAQLELEDFEEMLATKNDRSEYHDAPDQPHTLDADSSQLTTHSEEYVSCETGDDEGRLVTADVQQNVEKKRDCPEEPSEKLTTTSKRESRDRTNSDSHNYPSTESGYRSYDPLEDSDPK